MSTTVFAPRARAGRARPLRGTALALASGTILLGALFHVEVAAAIGVWYASTAYSHCFFVLPIAAYLAWERRAAAAAAAVAPYPLALVLAVPLAAAWLVAERLGIMEGRQLALVGLFEVLCLALLGVRMWRALAAPLLYLFFLVPFGAFLTPWLQHFTAQFIPVGLDFLGIANEVNDTIIEIPEGSFVVAEACAGLRFLIASVAFGALYSCLIYRSLWRRAAFMAVSVIVPIVANGFRALGIVVLGHVLGSAEAVEADHILYGWIFFSIVILLLIAAGLPFRQDRDPPVVRAGAAMPIDRIAAPAVLLALVAGFAVLTAAGPAMAWLFDRAGDHVGRTVEPHLAAARGCEAPRASTPVAVLGVPGLSWAFSCGGREVTATVLTFGVRANPAQLARVQRLVTGEDGADDSISHTLSVDGLTPSSWRETETSGPVQLSASSFWIAGAPAQAGLRGRATQAMHSVFGGATVPVLVVVAVKPPGVRLTPANSQSLVALLSEFLAAQPSLDEQIRTQSIVADR